MIRLILLLIIGALLLLIGRKPIEYIIISNKVYKIEIERTEKETSSSSSTRSYGKGANASKNYIVSNYRVFISKNNETVKLEGALFRKNSAEEREPPSHVYVYDTKRGPKIFPYNSDLSTAIITLEEVLLMLVLSGGFIFILLLR